MRNRIDHSSQLVFCHCDGYLGYGREMFFHFADPFRTAFYSRRLIRLILQPMNSFAVHLCDESSKSGRLIFSQCAEATPEAQFADCTDLIDGDLRVFSSDAYAQPASPVRMQRCCEWAHRDC